MSQRTTKVGFVRRLARAVLPGPIRRPVKTTLHKVSMIWHYRAFRRDPLASVRYFLFDRELDNFTYELSNEVELAQFMARVLAIDVDIASRYIQELQSDSGLRQAVNERLSSVPARNRSMPYGRRLGWYVVVRARKPRVIVETGIHDGLGSLVLLRAAERNRAEGITSDVLSFDIRSDVGWLIPDRLRSYHEIHIGDARRILAHALAGRRVDMFIHDSDHAYVNETREFETVLPLANEGAVLISDNAHAGTAFEDFCLRHGMPFEFFREIPRKHFYPGAGIGITFCGSNPKT
jgi:predicted O-methyltransferase YrrM